MTQSPLEIINKNDKEFFERIKEGRDFIFKEGALSTKHKLLTAMALDALSKTDNGVKTLATQAMANGATKNEIMETLRIVEYIGGIGPIYTAAMGLKDIL